MDRSPEDFREVNKIRINVHLEREKERISMDIDSDSTLMDLIREIGQPIDGILIFNGHEPLPLDTVLNDIKGNDIRLITVASGG